MRNARIQRVDCMTTRFSRVTRALGTTDVLGRTPLCCVGLSWVLEVTSLASTHYLAVAVPYPESCDNQKCVQTLPNVHTTYITNILTAYLNILSEFFPGSFN